jgi:hypothetical protein
VIKVGGNLYGGVHIEKFDVGGDLNFNAVQDRSQLVTALEKLKVQFDRAVQSGIFDDETARQADLGLTDAIMEAQKTQPNAQGVVARLGSALVLMQGVAAASGLVTNVASAIDLVRRLL